MKIREARTTRAEDNLSTLQQVMEKFLQKDENIIMLNMYKFIEKRSRSLLENMDWTGNKYVENWEKKNEQKDNYCFQAV